MLTSDTSNIEFLVWLRNKMDPWKCSGIVMGKHRNRKITQFYQHKILHRKYSQFPSKTISTIEDAIYCTKNSVEIGDSHKIKKKVSCGKEEGGGGTSDKK